MRHRAVGQSVARNDSVRLQSRSPALAYFLELEETGRLLQNDTTMSRRPSSYRLGESVPFAAPRGSGTWRSLGLAPIR